MRLLIRTFFFGLSPAAFGQKIESIEFRGLRGIPQDTMRATLHSKVGDILDENSLRQDFLTLWNSKRFDDIQVKNETDARGSLVVVFTSRKSRSRKILTAREFAHEKAADMSHRFRRAAIGPEPDWFLAGNVAGSTDTASISRAREFPPRRLRRRERT